MKKNIFTIILLLILLSLLAFIVISLYLPQNNSNISSVKITNPEIMNNINSEIIAPSEIKSTTFTLTALGDILCHNTQYWDAYNSSTDEYDFSYVFDDIKSYTSAGDITIANLETSFAGKDVGYSNYPTFNSPDSLATALKGVGIDIISTAGNHALDKGFSGLCRTIDVLDNNGIEHLGTYKSKGDQEKLLFKNIKGLNVAFINYTYGTNGIPVPDGKEFCINLIDKDLIKKQIEQAKDENADIIIACMHWGTEYQTNPNDEQKELSDFLFKNGVDIILGNHPHVLEPMEKRTVTLDDGTTKECFIIYALGNFTADQRETITRDSIILNLTVTFTNGKLSIDRANYIPIYMYNNPNKSSKKFKVLNIEKTISNYESGKDTSIGASTYELLKEQLIKIRNIVGEEF